MTNGTGDAAGKDIGVGGSCRTEARCGRDVDVVILARWGQCSRRGRWPEWPGGRGCSTYALPKSLVVQTSMLKVLLRENEGNIQAQE